MLVWSCDDCVSVALSFLSYSLCSFWWMSLSHRLQRSVYSLDVQQPRWINGRCECSNRALGSIHQTDWRCWGRNTPLCLCFKVYKCLFVHLAVCCIYKHILCVFLCVWISATVYVCVFRVRITGQDSDTDKSRTLTSPNAHFPSSASSKQRRQIITSLFFCLLSLYSFYSVYPKCCCGSMRD